MGQKGRGCGPVMGLFADPHYSLRPNETQRFFQNSLVKIKACMDKFREHDVDLVVCLGDLIDWCDGKPSAVKQLREAARLITDTKADVHLVMGNHDVVAVSQDDLISHFSLLSGGGYYSFDCKGVHFIVLNTNYAESGMPYTKDDMQWDKCYIDSRQLAWLRDDLAETVCPAVILTHANLDFRTAGGIQDRHVIKNHAEVRRILEDSKKVSMVFQGHCHPGFRNELNGITYLTLKAVVDGEFANYALLVSFGKEGSLHIKELF